MLTRRLTAQLVCQARLLSSSKMKVDAKMENGVPVPAHRLKSFGVNLWAEFSALSVKHQATNIGQGFPDFVVPEFLQKEVRDAVALPSANWYTRAAGHPRLVKALAEEFSPLMNHQIDPMTEVTTGVGAYEVIYAAIAAFVNEGDEAVVIEPHFDCYAGDMALCGGKLVRVPLRPTGDGTLAKNWKLDREEFEAAFNDRTKLLITTTPHNPVGKIFTTEELEYIGSVCEKHNVIIVSDEVYERVLFDNNKHVRVASLPGMWDRTITVGSAGKTFSVTGWKVGWALGPAPLIEQIQHITSCTTFTAPTLLQEAVAGAFEHEARIAHTEDAYFKWLPAKLQENCQKLADAFASIGCQPVWPDGGYFMLVDTAPMGWDFTAENTGRCYDVDCVKWLTREFKLATIPISVFYGDENRHLSAKYIRVCCAKSDATIDRACQIVRSLKKC